MFSPRNGLIAVGLVWNSLCLTDAAQARAADAPPCAGSAAENADAHAWAEAVFAQPGRQPLPPDALIVVHQRNHLMKNRTPWNTPITLAGKPYDHGLYFDSPATLRVTLSQPARQFVAAVGIDENKDTKSQPDRGSARFHVRVDGKKLFSSNVLKLADGPVALDVPLKAAREFVLDVDDAGDGIGWDQCDWADAAVILQDGTKRFLDEFPLLAQTGRRLRTPFSFTYNGRPCDEFLTQWDYAVKETTGDGRNTRTFFYSDKKTGLRVNCQVTTYTDSPAIDWVCELANEGKTDTPLIEQFMPLDATLLQGAPKAPVSLRWSNGDACSHDAFMPHTEPLQHGKTRQFAPVGGRSANGNFPFFNLMDASSGWILAIGWTGQWLAEFTSLKTGGVTVRAGMEKTRFKLHPGERVRTPRIVLLRWHGDESIRGHNLFRRLMLNHYVQKRNGQPAAPGVAHNTAATIYQTGKPTHEANQLVALNRAADVGCEFYWLDAYWYPQPWHLHVGDWVPRPDDFPHGIKPISDAAHKRGLKFILWFEPERIVKGTRWDREHPDFLLKLENKPNRLFNLADPKARQFLTDFIDERIKHWGLDTYRQDFNMDPLPYWRAIDPDDRQGITEMKYVEGLYRFWDDLLARNPHITIDNCASGGRRIDLETCSRSYPLWRSDCNDIGEGLKGEAYWPYMGRADQIHAAGLNLYIPFHTGSVWDERPYIWRSAMASGVVIYGDIESFSPQVTSQAVAELKSLRPFFLGDCYPLKTLILSQEDWYAYQLDRPDLGQGCALFFRRPDSPYSACDVRLNNIEPSATYEVSITGETYQQAPTKKISGADLQKPDVRINEKPGSALLRYKRIMGPSPK